MAKECIETESLNRWRAIDATYGLEYDSHDATNSVRRITHNTMQYVGTQYGSTLCVFQVRTGLELDDHDAVVTRGGHLWACKFKVEREALQQQESRATPSRGGQYESMSLDTKRRKKCSRLGARFHSTPTRVARTQESREAAVCEWRNTATTAVIRACCILFLWKKNPHFIAHTHKHHLEVKKETPHHACAHVHDLRGSDGGCCARRCQDAPQRSSGQLAELWVLHEPVPCVALLLRPRCPCMRVHEFLRTAHLYVTTYVVRHMAA